PTSHRLFTRLSCPASHSTPTTPNSSRSLHDALPIFGCASDASVVVEYHGQPGQYVGGNGSPEGFEEFGQHEPGQRDSFGWVVGEDRKSTRLNSSHVSISYAVFCLKKEKERDDSTYIC